MKRKFVVGLDKSTKSQNQQMIEYCKEQKVGYWHWLSNMWLLTCKNDNLKASTLRDALKEIYPGVHLLVLEINEEFDTWSGFGPNGDKRNMFKWINSTWDPALKEDDTSKNTDSDSGDSE